MAIRLRVEYKIPETKTHIDGNDLRIGDIAVKGSYCFLRTEDRIVSLLDPSVSFFKDYGELRFDKILPPGSVVTLTIPNKETAL